ncbi:hypothetical protein BaRGS_00022230, partial [Batillaria attramentaria]
GLDSADEYIATQAPLPSTIPDFWKMVFQQRSGVIVMLADCVEDGRTKVVPYWPEQGRPIRVCGEALHEDLTVTHFHLPGWWKDGGSLDPQELLNLIWSVKQLAPSIEGPITVHCSAGVGRTGMFIALYILTQVVERNNALTEVDVFSVVQSMMSCRPDIIQSEDQYIFIHEVLRVAIDSKLKQVSAPSVNQPFNVTPYGQHHNIRHSSTMHQKSDGPAVYHMTNGLNLNRMHSWSANTLSNGLNLSPMNSAGSELSSAYQAVNGYNGYEVYRGQDVHHVGNGVQRVSGGFPNRGYEDYRMAGHGMRIDIPE